MKNMRILHWSVYLESFLHLAYWVFYFSSVNTDWTADWTDRAIRHGVSQLTFLLYPIVFYANAFWLMPTYLKGQTWYRYFSISFGLVCIAEIARSVIFSWVRFDDSDLISLILVEFASNDNLIFGLPNSLAFAFMFSIIYRIARDWIFNQRIIARLKKEKSKMSEDLAELEVSLQARHTGQTDPLMEQIASVLDAKSKAYKSTFQAKRRDGTFILKSIDIAYLQAKGDFVSAIDGSGKSYMINHTLSVMEELLDPAAFFRINRSEMINAAYILKYANHTKNRLEVHFKEIDEVLHTSNSRTPEFRKWLESL